MIDREQGTWLEEQRKILLPSLASLEEVARSGTLRLEQGRGV